MTRLIYIKKCSHCPHKGVRWLGASGLSNVPYCWKSNRILPHEEREACGVKYGWLEAGIPDWCPLERKP